MRFFLSILLFFVVYSASALERNNFQIADSLVRESVIDICHALRNKSIDTIAMPHINHPAAWLIEQHFPEICNSKEISLTSDSSSLLKMYVYDLSTKYTELEPPSDSIIRSFRYSFRLNIDYDGEIKLLLKESYHFNDTISKYDYKAAEDYPFAIAKSDLPEESQGFFTKYLEPVLITSAAVLAIVLLFSLRSK